MITISCDEKQFGRLCMIICHSKHVPHAWFGKHSGLTIVSDWFNRMSCLIRPVIYKGVNTPDPSMFCQQLIERFCLGACSGHHAPHKHLGELGLQRPVWIDHFPRASLAKNISKRCTEMMEIDKSWVLSSFTSNTSKKYECKAGFKQVFKHFIYLTKCRYYLQWCSAALVTNFGVSYQRPFLKPTPRSFCSSSDFWQWILIPYGRAVWAPSQAL